MERLIILTIGIAILLFVFAFFAGKGFISSMMLVVSNFVLGFGSFYLIQLSSSWSGLHLALNGVSWATSGILGLPGTLLVTAVQNFLPV